jgi:hypothetical protein
MEPPLAGPHPVAFISEQIRKLRVKAEAQAASGPRCPSPEQRSRIIAERHRRGGGCVARSSTGIALGRPSDLPERVLHTFSQQLKPAW